VCIKTLGLKGTTGKKGAMELESESKEHLTPLKFHVDERHSQVQSGLKL
jgi:hypothetical protein